jgi:EAL domain-containing protein (putative c-di-GMP-specific phosphodiesterase class I)
VKKNGFIVAITDLVVDEVCKDLFTWIEKKK